MSSRRANERLKAGLCTAANARARANKISNWSVACALSRFGLRIGLERILNNRPLLSTYREASQTADGGLPENVPPEADRGCIAYMRTRPPS